MAASPGSATRASFDLKSATLPLISVVLRTADAAALAHEVERRLAEQADFFDHDPVLIDLAQLPPGSDIDFAALVRSLRRLRVQPVGVRGARADQLDAARAAGLTEAPDIPAPRAAAPAAAVAPPPPAVPSAMPTMVVERPLRSGQQVYARNADLIVMAAVSNGAEVIADGNVHVYAPLRGKAIAGARGNTAARIFATCMQPELVSIAGIYRTAETPLPEGILGRAAKISLVGEKLVIESLE
ncbi:septum site-determining protein MinC [Xylophilus rhododendri]|uniref:Probable septum site-determining protein MinC n=1 Tax=Xylophilus rhododendri TaxID=2697032 RepID=A0A857J516_9BURK|nr:septum site-determining protein MinC [Xylophilus rhododendri]QHI98906.1 septum site-determining protein MinC [Xylophilus rhododendri]